MNNRLAHLDIAKGITILVVVFTHSEAIRFHGDELFNILLSFNLTMFFFLSGMFFKTSQPFGQFFQQKSAGILKPYFATFLVCVPLVLLISNVKTALLFILGVLYAVGDAIIIPPLWFLPHLWTLFIFCYFLVKYSGFDSYPLEVKIIFVLSLLALGSYGLDAFWYIPVTLAGNSFELPGLPLTLDAVLISSFFFLTGYICKNAIINLKPEGKYVVLALIVFVLCHVFFDGIIDLNQRQYTVPVICTIQALASIYVILSISVKVAAMNNILQRGLLYFGKASLFIMMFHFPFQKHGFLWLESISGLSQYLNAFIAYIGSVVISVLMYELIHRLKWLRILWLPKEKA